MPTYALPSVVVIRVGRYLGDTSRLGWRMAVSRSSRPNRLPTPWSGGPIAPPPSWQPAHVALTNALRPRSGSPAAQSILAARLSHAAASNPSAASRPACSGYVLTNQSDHAFASGPN